MTTIPLAVLVAAGATPANAALYAPFLSEACTRRGVTAPTDVANLLAEVMNESGNLACVHECMDYRTAVRIVAVFPSHFPGGVRQAMAYVDQPQKLGDLVYASLGGYADRGAGLGELTGRDNFAHYAAAVGRPVATIGDWMSTPAGAADSAVDYFVRTGCRGLGNPTLVRDRWAGAPDGARPIGLPNVQRLYGILAAHLGAPAAAVASVRQSPAAMRSGNESDALNEASANGTLDFTGD